MKYFRFLLFSVFGFLVFGPVTDAYGDGHKGDHHGDHDGEPHDGWHCAICDLDFDSAEEMDEHAEEAGHLKDRGKPHGKPHRDHDGDDHGDHDGDDHGDHHGEEHHDGEPHDGWHCAICDLDFDSAEEMDEHAEEAGHLDDAGPTEGDFGTVDSSADGASGADGSSSK